MLNFNLNFFILLILINCLFGQSNSFFSIFKSPFAHPKTEALSHPTPALYSGHLRPIAQSRGGHHHSGEHHGGGHGWGWPTYHYYEDKSIDLYGLLGGISFASLLGATIIYLARRNSSTTNTGRRRRSFPEHLDLIQLMEDFDQDAQFN